MKKAVLGLFVVFIAFQLEAGNGTVQEALSQNDFMVVSEKGLVFSLGQEIDLGLSEIDFVNPTGIIENSSGSNWDILIFSNPDIEIRAYRKWKSILQIEIKSEEYSLARDIHLGDTEEVFFSRFSKRNFQQIDGGYIGFIPMVEEDSGYEYSNFLLIKLEDNQISEIKIGTTMD